MANTTKKVNKKMVIGLSNIVGSLLLIVITIVAALLIGHFVFGLFSSNSHNAGISISDASIIVPGGDYSTQGASISITIINSGNDPVTINTVQLVAGGTTYYLYSSNALPSGASGSAAAISPIGASSTGSITIEPGQSVTLSGVVTSGTTGFSGLQLQTGQTVVILVSGTDQVTAQTVSQQVSVVVQD
jgi:flagellin-like protein